LLIKTKEIVDMEVDPSAQRGSIEPLRSETRSMDVSSSTKPVTGNRSVPSPGQSSNPSEQWLLVERIAQSEVFRRSPFLKNFLCYICDRHLRGREHEITESQIGIYALGRPETYNPGDDNIVRNYARLLRKRLHEYYETEGTDEMIRISIPRGHYIPVFERRAAAEGVSGSALIEIALPQIPSEGFVASGKRGRSKETVQRFLRGRWSWAALLLTVSMIIAVFGIIRARSTTPYDRFWNELSEPSRTTFIITGDSGFRMLQDFTGKELHLHEYVSGDIESKFPPFNMSRSHNSGSYGAERFANMTSTADLSIAIRMIGSRHFLDMEDLKDANVVILGGAHSNPWAELYESSSNFSMSFPMHLNGEHLDERTFINKNPRPGEQAIYSNNASNGVYPTYALISLLPSVNGKGNALLLEGQNMAGTELASDFVLDPNTMMPILSKATLPDGTIGSFEILLETRTVGTNAPEGHIVVERFGPTGKAP
jgi:hypothetical protein